MEPNVGPAPMQTAQAMKLLLLWLCQTVSGHFIWLKADSANNVFVTFGESAGVPSAKRLLSMVADKICLSSHDVGGQQNVTLSTESSDSLHSQLIGHVAALPPFSLRLSATFGFYHEGSLLQYWSTADVVTKPNDWFTIQKWAPQKGLAITIWDPWMNYTSDVLADRINEALLTDSGNECNLHQGPVQDGAACVVAMILFNGKLLEAGVEVETFVGSGEMLNKTQSESGAIILKVPLDKMASSTPVWAKVNYHENVPGKYEGKDYTFVDHWATTYARIQRTVGNAAVMI